MSGQKGTASTRLLSMKFMQRAAATEANTSTPSTPNGPPTKRIRLSNSNSATPISELSDQQRLEKTRAEEELQRNAIIERLAAEAGETRWVLNVKEPAVETRPFTVVQTGFADLDSAENDDQGSEDSEEGEESTVRFVKGRMVFGQIKQAERESAENKGPESETGSSNSDSDESQASDHEQDTTYQAQRKAIAARKLAKMNPKQQERERLAALRRKREINLNMPHSDKEVNLSKLTSISGGAVTKPRSGSSYRPHPSRKH
ncbi:uncharacterized protein PV09_02142 [Verruconis gallopava]|uniref:Uncharacterized protein n=1 Tax=Verruconis gallopava TaxID=253628 RepID=A0A0D2AL83_9PEZI|nr:uncharacterized protein PV09_02142 [Verruconis gallopava]KIW07290.1 hypothetical protein PV09_02142 [Verruconis gallopava]